MGYKSQLTKEFDRDTNDGLVLDNVNSWRQLLRQTCYVGKLVIPPEHRHGAPMAFAEEWLTVPLPPA